MSHNKNMLFKKKKSAILWEKSSDAPEYMKSLLTNMN